MIPPFIFLFLLMQIRLDIAQTEARPVGPPWAILLFVSFALFFFLLGMSYFFLDLLFFADQQTRLDIA